MAANFVVPVDPIMKNRALIIYSKMAKIKMFLRISGETGSYPRRGAALMDSFLNLDRMH